MHEHNENMEGKGMMGGHKHDMRACECRCCHAWSSWKSPVGLGLFCFLTSIALAVTVYMLISIAGVLLTVSHSNETGPSAAQMQQLEQMRGGLNTGATQTQ